MSTISVKFKDRTVSVAVDSQKVSIKALTEACGEPIKCLKAGLQSLNPDKDGIISGVLINTTYTAISVNAAPKPSAQHQKPHPQSPHGQPAPDQKRLSKAPAPSHEGPLHTQTPEKRLSRVAPSSQPSHQGAEQKKLSRPLSVQPSHGLSQHPESPSFLHSSSSGGPDSRRLSRTPTGSDGPGAPKPQRASQHIPSASTSNKFNPQRVAPHPPGHRPSYSTSGENLARRSTPPAPSHRRTDLSLNDTPETSHKEPEKHSSSPTSSETPKTESSPAPTSPSSAGASSSPEEVLPPIDLTKLDKKERKKLEQARIYLDDLKKKYPDLDKLLTPDGKSVGNVPRWVPDDKSDNCTYCKAKFTVFERKHHCRKCGALLCSKCTDYKLDLPELFYKKAVRVCVSCFLSYYEGKLDSVFFDEPEESEEGNGGDGASGNGGGEGGDGSPSGDKPAEQKDPMTITFLNQPAKKPYVDEGEDDDDLPQDKNERMRIKCIREIVMTEEAYVNDLKVLEDVFVFPLRCNKAISPEIVQNLFSNVEMLRPVHEELLKELGESKAVTTGDSVGKAFVKMCQYLKMYSLYCSNHENAIDTLVKLREDATFQHALSVCQSDERAAGQNLDSYIIKPVQRVCKYPLFFRELLKYTPKASEDYENLDLARTKIEEVVSIINEGKRKSEEQRKIMSIFDSIDGEWEEDLLQPARGFVTEIDDLVGTDMRTNKKHTYSLFIFTDLIVVGKRQTGPTHHKPYILKGYIPMQEAKVIDIFDTDIFEVRRGNAQATLGKDSRVPVFQFVASDAEQKKTIIAQLKNLIKERLKESLSRQSSGTVLSRTTSMTALKVSQSSTPTATPSTPTGSGSSLSVVVPGRGSHEGCGTPQSPTAQSPRRTPRGNASSTSSSSTTPTSSGPTPRQIPHPPLRSVAAAAGGSGGAGGVRTPRRPAPPPPPKK